MKLLLMCILMTFAVAGFYSCEKPYAGGEDDTAETDGLPDNEDDEDDDGDNGGWIDGDDGNEDLSYSDTVSVTTFRHSAIYTQVWVRGYIVGAATGRNNKIRYEFGPEFTYDTALLLADSPDSDDVDNMISVCLTTCASSLRDKLNLADHPENKGRRIAVFGFQDYYLKMMGVKQIDACDFPVE